MPPPLPLPPAPRPPAVPPTGPPDAWPKPRPPPGTLGLNSAKASLTFVRMASVSASRLASDAARRGVAVARGDVDAVMRWFCARRSCSRMPRGLTLEVRAVGTLEVFPWNEPAAEVEHFARVAHRAGVDVREALLEDMLAWFCSRRECSRAVTPTLTATVETFGTLTLPAWIDPADGVENFAKAALHRAGALVPARTLRSLLEYFCAQRPCARTSIEAPWLAAEQPPPPRAPGNRMPSAFPGIADPKRI
mmetsp:Transcript_5684/g.19359  ORF Transcript_5684/g.19359 Transcript_5684/m.19359 type:complete len:249 (-) Transcript_5684:549-1295(-)